MDAKEMLKLLEQGLIRVVFENQTTADIRHTHGVEVIYFWNGGYYSSFVKDENNPYYGKLLKKLSEIIRIEKLMDNKYYPIWTKEDGLITQTEDFVKLNGRYYTISFLESLIDKISEFKKINI